MEVFQFPPHGWKFDPDLTSSREYSSQIPKMTGSGLPSDKRGELELAFSLIG
jgi:hypothetical protein